MHRGTTNLSCCPVASRKGTDFVRSVGSCYDTCQVDGGSVPSADRKRLHHDHGFGSGSFRGGYRLGDGIRRPARAVICRVVRANQLASYARGVWAGLGKTPRPNGHDVPRVPRTQFRSESGSQKDRFGTGRHSLRQRNVACCETRPGDFRQPNSSNTIGPCGRDSDDKLTQEGPLRVTGGRSVPVRVSKDWLERPRMDRTDRCQPAERQRCRVG